MWERDPKTHYGILAPEADGYYRIGLHNIADNNMWRMELRNLAISGALAAVPPAELEKATAIPGYNGEKKVEIHLTAPLQGMDRTPLQQLDFLVAECGGAEIWRKAAAPGERLQFEWTPDTEGEKTVSLYGETAGQRGLGTDLTFWCGIPHMAAPADITVRETEDEGTVEVKWQTVTTDAYGHSRNPNLVRYDICLPDSALIKGGIDADRDTVRLCAPGEQLTAALLVGARTEAGVTYAQAPAVVAGTPWGVPWRESWAGRTAAGSHCYEGAGDWWFYGDKSVTGLTSYDTDNGYLVHYTTVYGAEGVMTTGKIDLGALVKPMAVMRLLKYASTGDTNDNTVEISVVTDDGTETTVGGWRMGDLDYTNWNMVTADLSDFTGQTVRLRLRSVIRSLSMNFIDDMRVTENCGSNLAAGDITPPEKTVTGAPVTVNARVDNMGSKRSGKYTATLWRNGTAVQTLDRRAVAQGSSDWFTFDDTVNGGDVPQVEYALSVQMDGDGYAADDRCTGFMAVTGTTYPAVRDLTGDNSGGTVRLVWSAPSAEGLPTSENRSDDFEDGTSWSVSYRDWTFRDIDDSPVGGVEGVEFPNLEIGSKQSFWIHDATHENVLKDRFAAAFGTRYLASMFRRDEGQADDWAISPQLSGAAQTIGFSARSFDVNYPETVEVLVSNNGKATADFTAVAEYASVPGDWTRYSVELPQGARYFALRSKATGGFMLFLDDMVFEAAAGAAVDLQPLGYNVYRNGVRLNAAPVNECSWTDVPGGAPSPVYVVTAVYDLGESAPSNAVSMPSGVNSPSAPVLRAEGGKGVLRLTGCEGLKVTVTDCNGMVRYSSVTDGELTLSLEPGVYAVAAGGASGKVVVK